MAAVASLLRSKKYVHELYSESALAAAAGLTPADIAPVGIPAGLIEAEADAEAGFAAARHPLPPGAVTRKAPPGPLYASSLDSQKRKSVSPVPYAPDNPKGS